MVKKSAPRTQTGVISWSIWTPRTEKSYRDPTFSIAVGPLRPTPFRRLLCVNRGCWPVGWLRPSRAPEGPGRPARARGMWEARPGRMGALPAPPAGAEPQAWLSCSGTAGMAYLGAFRAPWPGSGT